MSQRVLILTWEYPPIVEGGLARHVHKLATGLAREGVEVHVLTRGPRATDAPEDRDGVLVHRVAERATPRDLDEFVAWVEGMNSHMTAAGRLLGRRVPFDLVHGHDWLVAGACAALAERLRLPYLTTIHATEYGRHQGWVDTHPQSYIHGIESWMANRAEHVITCSQYMREHVADVFGAPEARISVIPNGIDPGDLRPGDDLAALRARYAAPGERLVLLVGRLVYEKGFQLALEAMGGPDGLLARVDGVRFLVAGSGTHERQLEALAAELGIAERGEFLGWIGDDILHSLYRIADLCVVPSIYEPFGLVALEAMASECPCIVADTGGLREVVPNQDVGLRFTSRDPRMLGELMERVLTEPGLSERLVAEATVHVRTFDWADVARRTARIYADLGDAGGPAERVTGA